MNVRRYDIGMVRPSMEKWQKMLLDGEGFILFGGEMFHGILKGGRFADILKEESRSKFDSLAASDVGNGDGDTFFTVDDVPLELMVIPLSSGCTVFYRNIDSRLDTMERLAFFYRNFLNTSTSICITDEQGRIREANRSFLELYGYTPEEVIGKTPRILKSGRQSPDIYRELWKQLTNPEVEQWSGEIINRKKNGEEITVHLTVSSVRNFTGEHMGFIASTIDLTAHKRIERDLEDCNRELVETSQLKSDLMAITSHDLKSPLNAIVSRASMLRDMGAEMSLARRTEQLEKIIDSGKKMAAFIDELLDLEKIEAGRFQLSTARLHLDSLLQTCVETNMPTAKTKNILLDVQFVGEQEPIRADMMKLEQVFNNIISNAIKFTPKGGRVTVTCGGQPGSEKLITVADNGRGIPEAHLPHIFDRYYQAKNDGRAPGRVYGAGLGLSIVKNIVDLHGGSVTAANRAEGGCEFAIRLPANARARSGQDIAALIIDPRQEIYAFIEPYLRHKGVSCYVSVNLHEVNRVCRREHPELVFADPASLDEGLQGFLAAYKAGALMVAVTDGECERPPFFSRSLTAPVMDVEVFELIDELLLVDDKCEG